MFFLRILVCIFSTISFKDDNGRDFQWKGIDRSGDKPYKVRCSQQSLPRKVKHTNSLQLYAGAGDEASSGPIAEVHPAPAGLEPQSRPQAFLTLTPEALEIQDKVVLSFIFIEKHRKFDGESSWSGSNALNAPMFGLPPSL